jgi:hypothetical protein
MRAIISNTIGSVKHINNASIGIVTALGERIIVDRQYAVAVQLNQVVVVKQLNEVVYQVVAVEQWYSSYNEQLQEQQSQVTEVIEQLVVA